MVDIPISFKNFPQFIVIHTVKGFSIVNEAEVDAFLEFFCISYFSTYTKSLGKGKYILNIFDNFIYV